MSRSPHHRATHAALLILSSLLLGMTTSYAQQADDWPDWLKDAMAKESGQLKSVAVSAADGQYRFQLAGEAKAPGAFDGGWYFESDIGSEAPLECYLFSDDTDLATLVVNLAEVNIEANAAANSGPVGNRSVYALDAGAIEGAPYLAIEWMYTVGEAPKALLGYTKVRAAIRGDVVLACSHNFLGYRETFANAFAEFVRSAEQPEAEMVPYYQEVALQSIGGQRMGVTHVTYSRDADGDSMINMTSSSLVPVGPASINSSDSSTISWSTAEGELINVFMADSENGELVSNMRLDRNDDGDWVSSGTYQGKEIEHVIDGSLQPLSELGQMRVVKSLFESDDTEAFFQLWIANADPTRFLEGRLQRDNTMVTDAGTLSLGPLSFDARFDDDGALRRATTRMGAAEMTIDRVWTQGAPW